MCKDEGGEISVMVCHSKETAAGGVKFILIVVIRVGGG